MNRPLGIVPAPVRKQVIVNIGQEKAFRLFTAGMAGWWRPDHHIAPTPFATIVVEERTGGRWFERDKDGNECEWGKVLLWAPPDRLILSWQLNQNWQYDADFITELEIRFIAEAPDKTRVELEHRNLDKFGDKVDAVRAALDSADGWTGAMANFARAAG